MDPVTASQAAGAITSPAGGGDPMVSVLTELVNLLKTGGPYVLSVLAGWWGFLKDREKTEVQEAAVAAAKGAYDQMVTLVAAQTSALVKMEATVAALTTVIAAQDRRRERERDSG